MLAWRVSALGAAALAAVAALLLWASGVFTPMLVDSLAAALADSVVLGLLVGVVVFGGILFLQVSSASGGLAGFSRIVRDLDLSDARALVLIVTGIGITLESLTGYGVSMLLTVPLLLERVDRGRAILLALIGMSLMSWGALSVATILGAKLAGMPLAALGEAIVLTSGPVAVLLPLACVLAAGHRRGGEIGFALLAGLVLLAGIIATTRWVGVELAGVGGGLAVMMLTMSLAAKAGVRPFWRESAIAPYGLLIGLIVLQKFIVALLHDQGVALTLDTDRVSFDLLASPGIALAGVSLLSMRYLATVDGPANGWRILRDAAARAWRALVSIFLFLLAARIMIEVGAVERVAQQLSDLNAVPAAALITLLGGFGAYATGSGVASNALFMAGAAATGEALNATSVFAALQHSGAAHMAMASLPIIAILMAALPTRQPEDERRAMRSGLMLAAAWLSLVIASGAWQVASLS